MEGFRQSSSSYDTSRLYLLQEGGSVLFNDALNTLHLLLGTYWNPLTEHFSVRRKSGSVLQTNFFE